MWMTAVTALRGTGLSGHRHEPVGVQVELRPVGHRGHPQQRALALPQRDPGVVLGACSALGLVATTAGQVDHTLAVGVLDQLSTDGQEGALFEALVHLEVLAGPGESAL
jgi:hypothetical protein